MNSESIEMLRQPPVCLTLLASAAGFHVRSVTAADEQPRAFIDGQGRGWKALGESDFVNVNCDPGTWTWKDGAAHCTGKPVGVIRSQKQYKNFELVVQWRHLKSAGNSGVFVWTPEESLDRPEAGQTAARHRGAGARPRLRGAIRKARRARRPTGSRRNGDVFPVGESKMTPFPPTVARRQAELSREGAEQRRRPVEPLLHPRHQRRGAAVGQRRGSLRRHRLRAAHGLSVPGVGRFAGGVPRSEDS